MPAEIGYSADNGPVKGAARTPALQLSRHSRDRLAGGRPIEVSTRRFLTRRFLLLG